MCNALIERAKAVFCIGATGGRLAHIMAQSPSQSGASIYNCGDLATAVAMAKRDATPGDVVLLSPGCKSYGDFNNFEERGDAFARLARGA